MRAPFALAAHGLGGGEVAVFRAVAVPVPAGGRRARRRARREPARPRRRPRHRGDRGGAVRVQPDHAAGARHRPPGGAARRRAVGGRRARRAARAPDAGPACCSGSRSPTRRGRCWRSGRCCWRCRSGAVWALMIAWGIALAFMAPAAARVAPGRPAERARRADRRDLPALAGVVVLRLGGRGDPRRRRADQGGLPRGARRGCRRSPTR